MKHREYTGPGSKENELQRSAELYMKIAAEQGSVLALYFIHDSQHDLKDIKRILQIIEERNLGRQS